MTCLLAIKGDGNPCVLPVDGTGRPRLLKKTLAAIIVGWGVAAAVIAPESAKAAPISSFLLHSAPRAESDGAGTCVLAWRSNLSLQNGSVGDHDILTMRSTDGGATWSEPAALNSNAGTDSGGDYTVQMATDGAGNWIAVWVSSDSMGGAIGEDDDILFARSNDNGMTWSAAAALNPNAASDPGDDNYPKIATDKQGHWVVVWQSRETSGYPIAGKADLLAIRSDDNGASWSGPAVVNGSAVLDHLEWGDQPQLATDGAGNWVIVWGSEDPLGGTIGTDGDILFSRSMDHGAHWTTPTALNTDAAGDTTGDSTPSVASDGAGGWVAVWQRGSGATILCARSTDGGASWSDPGVVLDAASVPNGSVFDMRLATDGRGTWLTTWNYSEVFGNPEAFVARSTDGGLNWSRPIKLNKYSLITPDPYYDLDPHVTYTGLGGRWLAVWDRLAVFDGYYPEAIAAAVSTNNGATWSTRRILTDTTATAPPFGFSLPAALNSNASADSGFDGSPEILYDGAGHWVAVWESQDTLGGTVGADADILVALSSDGASWSGAKALNNNAGTDWGEDTLPQLATDGAGNWVAVWQSTDPFGGELWPDEDIFVARSADNGANWSAPAVVNANAAAGMGYDRAPRIATDGEGNWVVVWESDDPLDGTLGYDIDVLTARSTDNGATWSVPELLNDAGDEDVEDDLEPQIATDGAGRWIAAWQRGVPPGGYTGADLDILISRSADDGATWSPQSFLHPIEETDTGWDYSPWLASDAANNWIAVWTSSNSLGDTLGTDLDILVSRSADGGDSWSTPTAIGKYAETTGNPILGRGDDKVPRVVCDGAGSWAVVWENYDELGGRSSKDPDVAVARSTDNGATWTTPTLLVPWGIGVMDASTDATPSVAGDGAGNWVVAWRAENSLGQTIGSDEDIVFVRSTDNATTWSAPTPLNSNAYTVSADDWRVRTATDGAGTWVTVWDSEDTLGGTLGRDTDILYVRSTDNGETWSAPAALNDQAASDAISDREPACATDGVGTWVAAWSSANSLGDTIGNDIDIVFVRSTDNGETWSAPTVLNTNATTDEDPDERVRVATDGAGTWVAAWHTYDRSQGGVVRRDEDILIARSTDDGVTWSAPSPLEAHVSTKRIVDYGVRIATDGTGGWLAVWQSSDPLGGTVGTDYDIHFARSLDNGTTWSAPAALNSNAATDAGDDQCPRIAADKHGNWVAVWHSDDALNGMIEIDDDILVARSSDNGASWSAPAALDANAFRNDYQPDQEPEITTDEKGTWLANWNTLVDGGGYGLYYYSIQASRSTNNGRTWSRPTTFRDSFSPIGASNLDAHVATDGLGNWTIIWSSNDPLDDTIGLDIDLLFSRSASLGLEDNGAWPEWAGYR